MGNHHTRGAKAPFVFGDGDGCEKNQGLAEPQKGLYTNRYRDNICFMDNILSKNKMNPGLPVVALIGPDDVKQHVALRFRERRLAENMSRKTLASRSGVTEASIKRFENTGEISFSSLIFLAFSLGVQSEFLALCPEKPKIRLEDVLKTTRQRGRG